MGSLIRRLFDKFKTKSSQAEQWALCAIRSDGQQVGTALVRQNFKFRPKEYPWLILVELPILGKVRTDEENGSFELIEKELELIEQTGSMKLVATVGRFPTRTWIIYAKTESIVSNTIYEAVSPMGCSVKEFFDPKWHRYRELEI